MFVWVALSNFMIFPCMYTFYKRKMYYRFYIGNFTILASFMYHALDALNIEEFIITEYEWHILDNIGSIACINMLM